MPSILSGLFAGRAGLTAHGLALAVIGDNIANSNTLGFKGSRTEFTDVLAGKSSTVTVGVGSGVNRTTQIFEQGTLELTGRDLDAAIDGNGFFVVQDNNGANYYTRAGNFKVSADGLLVTQDGLKVLGYAANGSGALEELNLNQVSQDNVVTNNVSISGNLDARPAAIAGTGAIPAVDIAGVSATSTTTYAQLNDAAEYSTSLEVFDSQGGAHTVSVFFFKTSNNQYSVRSYVNSEDVDTTGSATGLPRLLASSTTAASGTITLGFDADGTMSASATTSLAVNVPWNNGSSGTGQITMDLANFTQFSSSATIRSITQDGQGVGNITSIAIAEDGSVSSILDNGQQALIGTIALANFANSEALSRVGGQLLQKSNDSGEPVIGTPGNGTFGNIASESVELSTVDIADQFIKLITFQRGFQANSRIITTVNQSLAELIQLA